MECGKLGNISKRRQWEATGIKECSKCKLPLPVEYFCKSSAQGLASWCKTCEKQKAARLNPRKTKRRADSDTHQECRRCDTVMPRSQFPKNKAMRLGIGQYCGPCQQIANSLSYAKNLEARKASAKIRAETPHVRMNTRVLQLVRKAMQRRGLKDKTSSVTASFWQAVGYTKTELANHIERQFVDGMSWENVKDWHIDHIIPVSSFSFKCYEDSEFKACWGLANLRPLWAKENLSKQNKILFLI